MTKYYSINEFSKIGGVSAQTLRNCEGFSMSKKKNKQKLNWIRLCEKGRIPTNCKYMNPRFTYDELHWYISVGIEVEDSTTIPLNNGIGIDLGIKDLAVCSLSLIHI